MLFEIEEQLFNKYLHTDSAIKNWVTVRASVLRSIAETFQYSRGSISNNSLKTNVSLNVILATYLSLKSILKFIFLVIKIFTQYFLQIIKIFLSQRIIISYLKMSY